MARTTPVHAGYTILNGAGTGPNGGRIQVWAEYKLGTPNAAANATPVTAYFYAALDPAYTSTTAYVGGLNSRFSVDGKAGTGVTGGDYDFTSPEKVNLLGAFSGNVPHNADGTKTMALEGSFTTLSSYITGGTLSVTVTLPAIPRAAKVTAKPVLLGQKANVSWTPAAASHSFSLTFALGAWQYTTGRLTPGSTGLYRYEGILPLAAAGQFSGVSGQMTVTLTTYSVNTVLGTDTATFTVTVPENDGTRPQVTALLTPECTAFPGQYVQRLSKIRADASATDPLGADIEALQLFVGGTLADGMVSAHLEQAGQITVTVRATNSRGFTGTHSQTVTVLPYDSPRLNNAVACRCLSDGTYDAAGTYLYISAAETHSAVAGKNSVTLRWRFKNEQVWRNLRTGVVSGVALAKDRAYTVQFQAVDTAGSVAETLLSIPTEQVYMHRTKDAMGLGGYARSGGVLELYWDLVANKAVSGVYIRTLDAAAQVQLQVSENQPVLVFGENVLGVVWTGSACKWTGTDGVSATLNQTQLTLTLPTGIRGKLVLISPGFLQI